MGLFVGWQVHNLLPMSVTLANNEIWGQLHVMAASTSSALLGSALGPLCGGFLRLVLLMVGFTNTFSSIFTYFRHKQELQWELHDVPFTDFYFNLVLANIMFLFVVLNNFAYVRKINLADFQFLLCTPCFIKLFLASI